MTTPLVDSATNTTALNLGTTNASPVNIGRSGQTVNVAGSLALGGNAITGAISLDGNNGVLSIGRGLGTLSNISIGKSNVAIDLNNIVRFGANGAVSAGTAGQVVTSGGAGQFTRWANVSLTTSQYTPSFSGVGFAVGEQKYANVQRVTITSTVGSKFLFLVNFSVTSGVSATQIARLSLAYTEANQNLTTANSFNIVNNAASSVLLTDLTSLAKMISGTNVSMTQTISFSYIYTWAGALTKSFALSFSGGPDFTVEYGGISYIQVG